MKQDFLNITDEKQLRLLKLCDAIETQRELHSMKMKVADMEVKIAMLKLSMAEEKLKEQCEIIARIHRCSLRNKDSLLSTIAFHESSLTKEGALSAALSRGKSQASLRQQLQPY